jgi:hypothetical protein
VQHSTPRNYRAALMAAASGPKRGYPSRLKLDLQGRHAPEDQVVRGGRRVAPPGPHRPLRGRPGPHRRATATPRGPVQQPPAAPSRRRRGADHLETIGAAAQRLHGGRTPHQILTKPPHPPGIMTTCHRGHLSPPIPAWKPECARGLAAPRQCHGRHATGGLCSTWLSDRSSLVCTLPGCLGCRIASQSGGTSLVRRANIANNSHQHFVGRRGLEPGTRSSKDVRLVFH